MLLAITLNSFFVAIAVLIHYEALRALSIIMPKITIKPHYRILFGFFGAMFAHIVEIWMFAFAYYFKKDVEIFGTLEGNFNHTLLDCGYFSFSVYTSLGFGDVYPTGHLRYLAGLEALTGLLMITWTASFMFIEMQKFWNKE